MARRADDIETAAEAIDGLLFGDEEGTEPEPEQELSGEPADDEPAAEGEIDDVAEDLDDDDEDADDDDDEPIAASADDDEDDRSDDAAEPDEDGAEAAAQPSTLDELAERVGVPPEDLLSAVNVQVKVDGETLAVPLQEAIAGYQKDQAWRRRMQALDQRRQEHDRQIMERAEHLERTHAENAWALNQIAGQLQAQLDAPEMRQLQATDAQQYLLRRQQLEDEIRRVNTLREQGARQLNDLQQRMQEQQLESLRQRVAGERELLGDYQSRSPEWTDDTQQELWQYLSGREYGFGEDELSQAYDHRLLKLAHKAMLWDRSRAAAKKPMRKIKQAPKLQQKPGKASSDSAPRRRRRNEARRLERRHARAGTTQSAAEVIASRLFGEE